MRIRPSLERVYLSRKHGTSIGSIQASERFQTLTLFSSIYGIGPNTARKLHALGLRTLEDLEVYYGVDKDAMRKDVAEEEIAWREEMRF